eukprot:3197240-Alexandrium_andersonii.AAC.1
MHGGAESDLQPETIAEVVAEPLRIDTLLNTALQRGIHADTDDPPVAQVRQTTGPLVSDVSLPSSSSASMHAPRQ